MLHISMEVISLTLNIMKNKDNLEMNLYSLIDEFILDYNAIKI